MKKYYTSIKFLCFFLVAVFLFQTTASAGPITGTVTAEPINAEETFVEVTSLREESVKTFQKGNGNYVAAIYGEAVHYKDEDGNWQEIDNSLIPTTVSAAQLADAGVNVTTANTSPVAYRKNVSNPFEVNLPNTLTVNNPITVTYKGHTLGFSLQDMSLQSGTVAEVVDTASKAKTTQLEEYSIISNDSILSYGQVFPNTQLTYEMRGKKLKESLIFSAPPTQATFAFRFYYEQLYPELLQTGEVQFYADNTKSGEPVFVIAAPYMFDSGEGYSAAVDVELVPVADGCLYKLTPDADWLNAKERVYPVTLDPTVTTSLTQTEIHDNCVHQSDPNTNYINADRLYVGSVVLSSGTFESRTYIKFPRVSSIPTTAFIVNATMTLNHHTNSSYQSASNNTIDVYDCGSNVWGTSNITWNAQKNFVFTNRICTRITDKSYSVENFDVTKLVRSWYKTTASNNGLVIKPRTVYTNASNRTGYYSSDISSSISSKRPHITIEYRNYKTITMKHFYDSAYNTRYTGTGANAPASKIASYQALYTNYMREVFGLNLTSSVTYQQSEQDRCTHGAGSNINSFCNLTLNGTCSYHSGRYHCTNAAHHLFTLPTGVSTPTNTQRVIKWTGHPLCEGCPSGGHIAVIGAVAVFNGSQISVRWADYLESDERDATSVGTIAHEMGHTFGCDDGGAEVHSNNSCVMKSGVSDLTKLSYINTCNPEAYCSNCRTLINNYINAL